MLKFFGTSDCKFEDPVLLLLNVFQAKRTIPRIILPEVGAAVLQRHMSGKNSTCGLTLRINLIDSVLLDQHTVH